MINEIPVYDISSVSEFRQKNLFVGRFGAYYDSHQDLKHSHRHSFYHVVLFTQGRGTHLVDFETFVVKPYQIYFMAPGQVHSWNFDGAVDGYIINFSAELFQSFLLEPDFLESFAFFRGAASDSVLQIPDALQARTTSLFEDILMESNTEAPFQLNMVRLLMMKIFILTSRLSLISEQPVSSLYNYTLLKNFQKLINVNYRTLRLPKDYAELLYITPNHLNALCNDLLGLSAGEVIRNRIFLEAKRLLINRDTNISEVANSLNFTDNSYFTKAFKRHVGLNPEEFRKKYDYGNIGQQ